MARKTKKRTPAKVWPATIPPKLRARVLRDQTRFLSRLVADLGDCTQAIDWLCDGQMLTGDVQRPGYHTAQKVVSDALCRATDKVQDRVNFMLSLAEEDGQ